MYSGCTIIGLYNGKLVLSTTGTFLNRQPTPLFPYSGSQPWANTVFLDCSSQNLWVAQLVVKASGNYNPRIPGWPKVGNYCPTQWLEDL